MSLSYPPEFQVHTNTLVLETQLWDPWCPENAVCYFWSQPSLGTFLSARGRVIFINGFCHRWLCSQLLHPWGLCLCLDACSKAFSLIFIYIDICCLLQHIQVYILEAKYHFCDGCHWVFGLQRMENTRIPACLWNCLSVFWWKCHIGSHF